MFKPSKCVEFRRVNELFARLNSSRIGNPRKTRAGSDANPLFANDLQNTHAKINHLHLFKPNLATYRYSKLTRSSNALG